MSQPARAYNPPHDNDQGPLDEDVPPPSLPPEGLALLRKRLSEVEDLDARGLLIDAEDVVL